MFNKILEWLRSMAGRIGGGINRMLGQSSVKQALKVDVAISALMAEALQLWSLMYENRAPWLGEVKSLNLPAAIAGEIARAVTIEMQVEISGSPRADFLAAQLEPVLGQLRDKVEQGAAKGGLMLKPFIAGGQIAGAPKLAVDFVQADQFYPVSFDASGNITACVFADQRTVGDRFYTRLEYHAMVQGGCVIRNEAFRSTSRDTLGQPAALGEVEAWAGLEEEATIVGIERPLFAYFRFPLANNVDPASPLGVSCYARAVDLIRDADVQWSNLLWEFESGQRALYVDELAFSKDPRTGKPVLPNKRLYRTLEQGGELSGEEMFHEWTPSLREENILRGLDSILKRIEFACGLAYGTLSDPATVDKTATEIKTSKQRTYATITDTQKALQRALEQLIWAMDMWATLAKLAPRGTYATAFDFDDSVIVDKDLQFQQDLRLVGSGIMSKVEFRIRNFGEDEATAKAKLAEIQAEQPAEFFQQEG